MAGIGMDRRGAEEIMKAHPFLDWVGRMHALGSRYDNPAGMQGQPKFFVLSDTASARFGLDVDEDGQISLGVLLEDITGLMSVKWATVAFSPKLRDYQDFIILSCRDVMEGWPTAPMELPPVEQKVFVRLSNTYGSALLEAEPRPSTVRVRPMMVRDGKGYISLRKTTAEIPLTYVVNVA